MVALVVACGGDGSPGGYGGSHRAAFVDDCADGTVDRQTCGCFYDRIADEVSFERFERLDLELRRPLTDLPDDLATFAAGCTARHQASDDV